MGRSSNAAPPRVRWAIDLLHASPDDQILEIGCGPGIAVRLLCERLDRGRVTAIDRSATAIDRAQTRNTDHVAAGRASFVQTDLAGFEGQAEHFDKALAVNVNVFWTSPAETECTVLRHVLRPGGTVRLVYEGPSPEGGRDVGPAVATTLAAHDFETAISRDPTGTMLCITGHRRR